MIGTNNSLEAINRIIKENITPYLKKDLGEFFEIMFNEIKNMGENLESESVKIRFPILNNIDNEIYIIAKYLLDSFEDYFITKSNHNEKNYFIKDKSIDFNYYKGGKNRKQLAEYIKNENNKNSILTKFSRPQFYDINSYLNDVKEIKMEKQFIDIFCIRRVVVNMESFEYSTCTCPTFFTVGVCVHLITCLGKLGGISFPLILSNTKKSSGRPEKN